MFWNHFIEYFDDFEIELIIFIMSWVFSVQSSVRTYSTCKTLRAPVTRLCSF